MILDDAVVFRYAILHCLKNKQSALLITCLNLYEGSTRSVLCWKTLTRTEDFLLVMKSLFTSSEDRRLFCRYLLLFLKFLTSSAVKNESERSELLSIKNNFEQHIEEFLGDDYFDEAANVMALLFLSETPQTQSIFNEDICLLGYCLDNEIKILFNNAIVVTTLNNIFRYHPMQQYNSRLRIPTYHRFSPKVIYILEILSKALLLLLIGTVSISDYGSSYGTDFSSHINSWSTSEITLAIIFASVLVHEVGELSDSGWSIVGYFSDSWNTLDFSSSILGLIWLGSRIASSNLSLIRVSLALQAIPEALGLLRFLSINQSLGELVIMVAAMMYELVYFIVLYLVSLIGFSICLRGLFYGESDYSSNSSTALTVFSIAFGNYDFSFSATNSAVNVLGVLLVVVIIVFTSVLLINLLIAQMTNSYQRVKDEAFREWAFSYARIVRQCVLRNDMNVMIMLPAPLNLLSLLLVLPHYILMNINRSPQSAEKDDRTKEICVSLAGMIVNALFDLAFSPVKHFLIYSELFREFLREYLGLATLSSKHIVSRMVKLIAAFVFLIFYVIYYIPYAQVKFIMECSKVNDWKSFFDVMERQRVGDNLLWQFVSVRENGLTTNEVATDANTEASTIKLYYELPRIDITAKPPAESVIAPIVDVLYSEAGSQRSLTKSQLISELKTVVTAMTSIIDDKSVDIAKSIRSDMSQDFSAVNEKIQQQASTILSLEERLKGIEAMQTEILSLLRRS